MRFPLWERLEMALMWAVPMCAVAGLMLWPQVGPGAAGVGALALAATLFAIFASLRWLPVWGSTRWLTYAGGALLATALAASGDALLRGPDAKHLAYFAVIGSLAMLVLSFDLSGTTPWYPSTINTAGNHFDLELDSARCTGAADCLLVCPRDVLAMKARTRKVSLARPEACLRCGACVVQCPEDALRFRFRDGRVVEAPKIRRTRMNLVGRRTLEVGEGAEAGRNSPPRSRSRFSSRASPRPPASSRGMQAGVRKPHART